MPPSFPFTCFDQMGYIMISVREEPVQQLKWEFELGWQTKVL